VALGDFFRMHFSIHKVTIVDKVTPSYNPHSK